MQGCLAKCSTETGAHVKKLEWSKLSSSCRVASEMNTLLHSSRQKPSRSPVSAADMPSPRYLELCVRCCQAV